MAKGKHSVALFEVIQRGKSSSRASSLRTPKWWFKRQKNDAAAEPPPQTAIAVVAEPTTAPAPRNPAVDLELDPDRKRIKFDVSYSSAIVAAFTVVVVVGLAYVIGSHMTRGPSAAEGASTADILKGPAQPDVMKVGSNTPIIPPMDGNPKPTKQETINTPPVPAPVVSTTPQPPAAGPKGREAGQNYAVIQSFPAASKAMAFEIAEFLNTNGLPCSVMTNLSDYRGLFVVVGLDGFQRIRTPEYRDYENRIRTLSDKYGKERQLRKLSVQRFNEPLPRQWQGTEKLATAE